MGVQFVGTKGACGGKTREVGECQWGWEAPPSLGTPMGSRSLAGNFMLTPEGRAIPVPLGYWCNWKPLGRRLKDSRRERGGLGAQRKEGAGSGSGWDQAQGHVLGDRAMGPVWFGDTEGGLPPAAGTRWQFWGWHRAAQPGASFSTRAQPGRLFNLSGL